MSSSSHSSANGFKEKTWYMINKSTLLRVGDTAAHKFHSLCLLNSMIASQRALLKYSIFGVPAVLRSCLMFDCLLNSQWKHFFTPASSGCLRSDAGMASQKKRGTNPPYF
jgi:hypothetical protein